MVDYVNDNRPDHIITIEDPIEFVHESKRCLINQREVHRDTLGFSEALRSALREDPDVVLVGEMRDLETIRLALTGGGDRATSCSARCTRARPPRRSTASSTCSRRPRRKWSASMLSESLRAVISQTLLKRLGGGRIAAHEIMIGDPGDPEPDPREQDRADVLVDPDRPGAGHADARPVPDRDAREGQVSKEEARYKAANKDSM